MSAVPFLASQRNGELSIEYEDYTCIGGEQSFMQQFLAEAGGLGPLKQNFFSSPRKGGHSTSVASNKELH